jgi:hypothetical protein
MGQALQALERIIDYNLQKKRADVQESLQFMQFAMQKKQADIKEFGMQMETVQKANQMASIKVADSFVKSSGLERALSIIPVDAEGVKDADKELSNLAEKLQTKEYGDFNKVNAMRTASALWSYKTTKDPNSIISYVNNIEDTINLPVKKRTGQHSNLINSLLRIGNEEAITDLIRKASDVKRNNESILREQFQFARGDNKITSTWGIFGEEALKDYNDKKGMTPEEEELLKSIENTIGDMKSLEEEKEEEESLLDAIPKTKVATGLGIATAIGGAVTAEQALEAEEIFNKRLANDIQRKLKKDVHGMGHKEFGEKYKYTDPKTGKPKLMTKTFAKTKAGKQILLEQAKAYGKSETSIAKLGKNIKRPYEWAKDLDWGKGGYARSIAPMFAPVVLPTVGEKIGGMFGDDENKEKAEFYGRGAGTGASSAILVNKAKYGRTFINYLASKVPHIAAKAGVAAMADSPALPFGDILALGIAGADVYNYWNEWNDLYGDRK